MTDFESIESSVGRVDASLRVLLHDQGPLALAHTLEAARDALGCVRRLLTGNPSAAKELRATMDFLERLTSILGPVFAGAPVQSRESR
jgi:hypothetical protein